MYIEINNLYELVVFLFFLKISTVIPVWKKNQHKEHINNHSTLKTQMSRKPASRRY